LAKKLYSVKRNTPLQQRKIAQKTSSQQEQPITITILITPVAAISPSRAELSEK
jgi:hypothetical protein